MGNHKVAEKLYHKAIAQAKDMIITAKADAADEKQLQRVLSDREGNLAVSYLEQNDFPKAFELLERLLEEDKQALYIRGCVVKQGTLGQYYLKQGEIKSAERVFLSALTFIRNLKTQQGSNTINGSGLQDLAEIEGAEQIALFNMALLYEAMYKQNNVTTPYHIVEAKFLEALTTPTKMHVSTVKKILLVLRQMFQDNNNESMINQLDELTVQHDFILTSNTRSGGGGMSNAQSTAKSVAFAVDYSGSMSGMKIRSAMENLRSIFEHHIHSQDKMLLIKFNQHVETILPLTIKNGNETFIRSKIDSLTTPNGGTAFYDAVHHSLSAFRAASNISGSNNNWVITLTDGEDNGSITTLPQLLREVGQAQCGLIVIGVGSDVQLSCLQEIAKAAKKGEFVFAEGDKKSIDDAFGQVAQLIQGQVLLEEC